MVVASGYVEANELSDVEMVVNNLKAMDIEVNDVNEEKVVFVIERETAVEVKKKLDSLRDVAGVRNVYLAYFSLEDVDGNAAKFTES
ncbi:MAG: chaperone NapD [Thermodesulfovibrionales bacterium]|nr:chaperone NapD [Thermodesulfovibrionales bacterium]